METHTGAHASGKAWSEFTRRDFDADAADVQLALDIPGTSTIPVTFVTVCHLCGERVSAQRIEDAADTWNEPVLWGYVAKQAHDRDNHPDHYRGPNTPEGDTTK